MISREAASPPSRRPEKRDIFSAGCLHRLMKVAIKEKANAGRCSNTRACCYTTVRDPHFRILDIPSLLRVGTEITERPSLSQIRRRKATLPDTNWAVNHFNYLNSITYLYSHHSFQNKSKLRTRSKRNRLTPTRKERFVPVARRCTEEATDAI